MKAIKILLRNALIKYWLLIILLLLFSIYFLAYFPGILSVDVLYQWSLKNNLGHYDSWHPALHTFILYLGTIFVSSPVFVVVFQIIFAAFVFWYAYCLARKAGLNIFVYSLVVMLVFINPVNPLMLVSLGKDTLFGVSLVFFTLMLFNLIWLEKKFNIFSLQGFLFAFSVIISAGVRYNGLGVMIALFFCLCCYSRFSTRPIFFKLCLVLLASIIAIFVFDRVLVDSPRRPPMFMSIVQCDLVLSQGNGGKNSLNYFNNFVNLDSIYPLVYKYSNWTDYITYDPSFKLVEYNNNLNKVIGTYFTQFWKSPTESLKCLLVYNSPPWNFEYGGFVYPTSTDRCGKTDYRCLEMKLNGLLDTKSLLPGLKARIDNVIGTNSAGVRGIFFSPALYLRIFVIFSFFIIFYVADPLAFVFLVAPGLLNIIIMFFHSPSTVEARYFYFYFLFLPVETLMVQYFIKLKKGKKHGRGGF